MCGGGRDDAMVSIRGDARVGDMVEVDMPDAQVLKVSAIAYVIPLLGLLLGLWLGSLLFQNQELLVFGTGILMLALAYAGVKGFDARAALHPRWQPRLIRVLGPEETQDPDRNGQ